MKNSIKSLSFPAVVIISFLVFSFTFTAARAQYYPELTEVLENLNNDFSTVTSLIPNRYDFSEGETGNYIYSGNGMFYYGNYISTNIGEYVSYSNNAINSSSYFGGQGQYFTRKYPGLFVLTANLNGVSEFIVSGNYDFYYPNLDGAVLTSGLYKGFVKRAISTWGAPSVNHLIIVKDEPGVNHTYYNSYENYYHTISGLNNNNRIYFMLYAATSDYYIDDEATQQIMDAFVALLVTDTIPPNPASNLSVSEILNTSALLTWTAPHDDSLTEPVNAYDIRLSTTPMTTGNYFTQPVYQHSLTPGVPGSTESLTLTGLNGQTYYWAGICSVDEGGNYATPVITAFLSGTDPAISVSVENMDFEAPLGTDIVESFTISNTNTGSSPLSYNISAGNTSFSESLSFVAKDNWYLSKVNFITNKVDDFEMNAPISDLNYVKAKGDVWITSRDYNKITVFSALTNTTQTQMNLSNLFKVCVPKNQNKVYALYSSNPVKVNVYNPSTYQLESSFNLGINSQPYDAQVSSDGTKIYTSDYYYLNTFSAENGNLISSFETGFWDNFRFIISNDGGHAFCYFYNYLVKINLQNGSVTSFDAISQISAITLSPDDQFVFIGYSGYSYSNRIDRLNAQTMQHNATMSKNVYETTRDLYVTANGNELYCLNDYQPNIFVFNLGSLAQTKTYNVGGSTSKFTFGSGFDQHIEINPTAGTIAGGASQNIEIKITTNYLMPGIYNFDLLIENNDPNNELVTIPVTFYAKDVTGPDFNIVFFQNHYLTRNMRVLVFAREELPDNPVLSDGSANLNVEVLDMQNHLFYSEYKLSTTENIAFTVTGVDSVGNSSSFEKILSITKALKNCEVIAQYPNNEVNLSLTADAINQDLFVTIWKDAVEDQIIYHIGPDALALNEFANLSLSFSNCFDKISNPSHLSIYMKNQELDTWIPIASTINHENKKVNARIDQLGTFKIGFDENNHSPDESTLSSLSQSISVSPNPFNEATTITYHNPADGIVTINLFDRYGTNAISPISMYQDKGIQTMTLSGQALKSGIYFVRITTPGQELVQKVVRID